MGKFVKEGKGLAYQQENGEITAWFSDAEERMELSHEGDSTYKKVFYLLVIAGLVYLVLIFTLF